MPPPAITSCLRRQLRRSPPTNPFVSAHLFASKSLPCLGSNSTHCFLATTQRASASTSSSPPSSSSSSPPSPPSPSPSPPSPTHYDLFPQTLPHGPPPRGAFAIDVRALRLEFLSLQARQHPDTQPAARRGAAEAVSARLNDAYRTLCDPLLRAQYLLQLGGIDVGNDDSARVTADDDADVLMQVMDAWEAMEAAGKAADLEPARGANDARIRLAEQRLGELFGDGNWEGAKKEAVRLRYWRNVREALDNWDGSGGSAVQH